MITGPPPVHLTLGRPDTRTTVDDFWQHGVKKMEHSRTTEKDAGAGGIECECPSEGTRAEAVFSARDMTVPVLSVGNETSPIWSRDAE